MKKLGAITARHHYAEGMLSASLPLPRNLQELQVASMTTNESLYPAQSLPIHPKALAREHLWGIFSPSALLQGCSWAPQARFAPL